MKWAEDEILGEGKDKKKRKTKEGREPTDGATENDEKKMTTDLRLLMVAIASFSVTFCLGTKH